MIDLTGEWALSDESGRFQAAMVLPGDGISALHKAGLIPDPYWGQNEYGLRWISERDWTIRREVVLERTDLDLVATMLDTVAEIRINGQAVLTAASMFREHRADVSAALRKGSNTVEIVFRSVVAEAAARQAAQPYFVPFSANNTPIHNGNMLRKPACDFGWDWNIALATFGLYGDLALVPRVAARIGAVVVAQTHTKGRAVVTVTTEVVGEAEGADVAVTLCGHSATTAVKGGRASAEIVVADPQLWWPAGLGPQVLHDLTVTMGAETAHRRIGLRDARLVNVRDDAGLGFKFVINGHDVFARGANWIPADALAGRITPETVRNLLQSAVDANMNMIRVWGGGRYEPDWFYDLCDALGLMIWQDFMFSCHIYPSDDAFLADVAAEVREQSRRLNHHACLVLWCGDNELIGALTWFPETRANRDLYLVGYDRLNRTIETALKAAVPDAVWWPSSPSPGPMDFGDAWHDDTKGDMHFWSVWHEGRDFDHYRDVSPRFCSEFGFQSYPSLTEIRRFADTADFNIAAPVMESHQKNAGGNARIAETMFRYFRFPVDFENFVYLSQVQQGLAIKTAVSHWRSLRPHCMGTLFWQLNDTWPVCSWSSLDHSGNWKLLHHMAKRFFAPIYVSVVPENGQFTLRAVNDTRATIELSLQLAAVQMDGTTRPLGETRISLGTGTAQTIAEVAADALTPDEVLAYTWQGSEGTTSGDVFAPKPWKAYDLQPADLRHSVQPYADHHDIMIDTSALAPFVAVEADVPGRFSANAVTLFPGHTAHITFTPDGAGPAPTFVLRDLQSATYGPRKDRP
jgi:beta-mannosidase